MSKKPHVHLLACEAGWVAPTTPLPLREALFVYGEKPGDGYVLQHAVRPDGTLSPGKPLDCAELAHALLDVAARRATERLTYLPAHILAAGRKTTVWWRPAQSTPLWFKTAEPRLSALNGKPIPCPALVFRADERGLDVWALMGNERPYPETPLMLAPFMNLMGSGHDVCLGTARDGALADAANKATTTEAWERLFFDSNFTHTHPSMNYAKGEDYIGLLELLSIGLAEFPVCRLKPAQQTLADVLTS